jgi:hypothetical protein
MRIVSVLSVSVGLFFVLACGGASTDTTPIPWEGPDVVLPEVAPTTAPSPEAIQPAAVVADVDRTDDAVAVVAAVAEDVVNKPVGAETPSPAPAPVAVGVGQIQLTTGAGIQPMVDGVPMRLTTSQGYLSEVSAGKHSLEIRNLLGSVTGSAEVDVLGGRRVRYEWRRRSLSLLGDVASSPMPAAVDWDEVFEVDEAASTVGDDKQPLQPASGMDKK